MNRERPFGWNDELKLGEDNSDPIKVHLELKNVSSPRPSVSALATEIFGKILVASTRIHLLSMSGTLAKLSREGAATPT